MLYRRRPAASWSWQATGKWLPNVSEYKTTWRKSLTAISYKPREGDILTVIYSDYFDHLLPWYERRNDSNVLFITYKELKSDTKTFVLRIADFLGENQAASLHEEQGLLERVLYASSLNSMKAMFKEKPGESRKKMAAVALEKGMPF